MCLTGQTKTLYDISNLSSVENSLQKFPKSEMYLVDHRW